ncbi:MAG: hypothetical protein KGQ38_02070 [Actinomycetales bacterium]|nr:hypothetical protein [Actinomycetales bacterium]
MKKLIVILVGLLLTGCSFTSTYTINGDGTVSGTATFGVPKSAVRNVTTVEQWQKVLDDNNFPAPTASADPQESASPAPSASCAAGEDNVLGQWIYSCEVLGDFSVFDDASSATGSSDLKFSREGRTLTITQVSSQNSDGTGNPFSLNGISLFYVTTTMTMPGTVTSVSGTAEKVNDNTVTFTTDEKQNDAASATVTLLDATTTPTSLSLDANVESGYDGQSQVTLSAKLGSPHNGQVEFFDGDISLGITDVDQEGAAVFSPADPQTDGTHDYRAKFLPNNWWSLDQSTASKSIQISTFKITNNVKITGASKVGAKLSASKVKSSPSASKVNYQWLRNGQPIKGATRNTYVVSSKDFKKSIMVQITLQKTNVVGVQTTSNSISISKR